MRISTDQGKFHFVVFLVIAGALICLLLYSRQPTAPASIAKLETTHRQERTRSRVQGIEQKIASGNVVSLPPSVPAGARAFPEPPDSQAGARAYPEEFFDKLERGRERKIKKQRERYDQPMEAAQRRISRRLPDGESELKFEWYEQAREQTLEMPRYSTSQRSLLPSLRASGQSFSTAPEEATALGGWTSLGPGNIGGRTRALLVSPKDPEVMFAGAAAGGIWKTTNGGKQWTPLADLMANLAVNALAFDPSNPEIIYAGTGEGFFNGDSVRGAGIFRSLDGGQTWRRLEGTGTADFWYVNDIVVSKSNVRRIYAATRIGVMRSTDGGVTWTRVLDESSNNGCTDLAIRTDSLNDVVFAACGLMDLAKNSRVEVSIFRNDNAGGLGQWEAVHSEAGLARTSLAIAPSNQNVIYAVSAGNGSGGRTPHALHAVFRSNGGGAVGTWTTVNDGTSNRLNATLFSNPLYAFLSDCFPGSKNSDLAQGWYNNVIAVDPLNENIVWVGGVDLFRSDDGGVNWGMASFWDEEKTSSRYVHADQHVLVFHPQFNGATNRTLFVGNDGGIFRTDSARGQTVSGNRAPCSAIQSRVSWTSLNNGYAVTQFYHGAVFPGGQSYLGGTQDNGVIYGSDELGPNNWIERMSGDGGQVAIDPFNPQIVYAENTFLALKKSTDGGVTFVAATTGISNIGFKFIAPLTMDPSDPARLWLGGASLWRTRNNADNWSQAGAPLKGSATAIAVAPTDSNFVLAGTDQGVIHRTAIGLNSSADTVWPDSRPRTGTNITISSLAFDPTNRDIAYATVSNFGGKHVFRTVNSGASWQAIDGAPGAGGLPDIPVNCIVVDPTDTQRLYVGTDLGVFTSPDGGMTWAVENTGFANVPVEWLTINAYKGAAHLFAFTHGRGAWRVPLGQVCTSVPSPQSQTFDATGGKGNVQVIVSGSSCEWTVENKNPWITVTSSPAMRGSGTVSFQVAPSPDRKPRTASLTIGGTSFVVTQAGEASCVSAASFAAGPFAPESMVTAFGGGMADRTQIPDGAQLPTKLAGVSVMVKDQTGRERPSPLFFVSPFQINFLIPTGTAPGPALATIYSGNDKAFNSHLEIKPVSPALFTADGSGKGVPMGHVLRVKADNQSFSEMIWMMDSGQAQVIPRPIDLGKDSDRLFLVLFGTGIRFKSSISAAIGGQSAIVHFAGAQADFVGLDQLNIEIPRTLAGRGEVELLLTVDGQKTNPVLLHIK